MMISDGKRMTLREIADVTGASYRTVADYAQRAGWTRNGVQTLLDERQTALIVEAMKATAGQGQSATLQENLQGLSLAESRSVRLAALYRQRDELSARVEAELKAELEEKKVELALLEAQKAEAQRLLEEKTIQLEENCQWYTVKRVAKLNGVDWRSISWRNLKNDSRAMEIEVKKVFDPNLGHVNSYHIDVWRHNYGHFRY